MKRLLYPLGGLLLVIGAALPLFVDNFAWAFFTFAPGALLFAAAQVADRYDGDDLVKRRLRRQQLIGAALLVVTACLMLTHWLHLPPARGDEWKVTLMIAAILETYTIFRLN